MLRIGDVTLNSFVRTECANFTKTNECIGVDLKGKGFNLDGACWIIKEKKPCKYFRKCVLPLAEQQGIYSRILLEYTNIDKSIGTGIHTRFCECGTELKPRERFCGKCKKIRRLETKRGYQQKYRGS
jgi:hypothetical protein